MDTVAGRVPVGFVEAAASIPLINDGKLKAIAVSSQEPIPQLVNTPTIAQSLGGEPFEAVSWHVLFAPSQTPEPIVQMLHTEVGRITTTPEFRKKVSDLGLIPVASQSIDEIRTFIRLEREKWGALVARAGLQKSQ